MFIPSVSSSIVDQKRAFSLCTTVGVLVVVLFAVFVAHVMPTDQLTYVSIQLHTAVVCCGLACCRRWYRRRRDCEIHI